MRSKKRAPTQDRGGGNAQHVGEKRSPNGTCAADLESNQSTGAGQRLQRDFFKNMKLMDCLLYLNALRGDFHN